MYQHLLSSVLISPITAAENNRSLEFWKSLSSSEPRNRKENLIERKQVSSFLSHFPSSTFHCTHRQHPYHRPSGSRTRNWKMRTHGIKFGEDLIGSNQNDCLTPLLLKSNEVFTGNKLKNLHTHQFFASSIEFRSNLKFRECQAEKSRPRTEVHPARQPWNRNHRPSPGKNQKKGIRFTFLDKFRRSSQEKKDIQRRRSSAGQGDDGDVPRKKSGGHLNVEHEPHSTPTFWMSS